MIETASNPRRYVLSDDAPLLANLAALWRIDPNLAAASECRHPTPSYPVQISKSGLPTVAIPKPGAGSVCLHSRYQPLDEANRMIDAIELTARLWFYVFGFGLGYHVEALFERAGKDAIFCVFEPDLLLLRTAFEQRDYSK